MKTLGIIFALALLAVAGSVYTDVMFTSAQSAQTAASTFPMAQN